MTITGMKRGLFLSTVALLLCFVLLLGTTFAWFTSSVTSSNNIIKAGNLDVTMSWADGKEDPASANWADASEGAIFNYTLWEPGYTQVRHIKIENVGSLALKYQVMIAANGEVTDLADVIDVYYADPAVQVADRASVAAMEKIGTLAEVLAGLATTGNGTLESGASDTVTIVLKMQESAGNSYMLKSIGSTFSVQLFATQYTVEEDSFDDQYDADAVWPTPAKNAADLKDALANDEDVQLAGDISFAGVAQTPDRNNYVEVYGNKVGFAQYGGTIDGNGNTITDTEGDKSYVIVTHGGTIKNVKITSGARGIVTYSPTENVILDNVVVDGPGYALNSTEHGAVEMIVSNSTIKGWTSLAGFTKVEFNNCLLGENSLGYWQGMGYDQDYDRLFRVYSSTAFNDCEFEQGYYLDLSAGGTATLKNCTVNGVVLTADNYADYVTIELPAGQTLSDCVSFN